MSYYHQYGYANDYNSLCHIRYCECSDCGGYVLAYHEYENIGGLTLCVDCGRRQIN